MERRAMALMADPAPFLVRLPGEDGSSVGLGVLVGPRRVVTCAHVVNVALGRDPREQGYPGHSIPVDFLAVTHAQGCPAPYSASVELWKPPPVHPGDECADIAGLVLDDDVDLPVGVEPARLSQDLPRAGQDLHVFGYPSGQLSGVYARALAVGPIGDRLQLDSVVSAAWWVQPGFSGSPVYDPTTGCVVGIVVLASRPGTGAGTRTGYTHAIQARALIDAWPEAGIETCRLQQPKTGKKGKVKFKFVVDTLKDYDTITSGTPLVIEGHYEGEPRPVRVVLKDVYGNYYVQNPPVDFAPEGQWYATNICVGEGILFVIFLELDQASVDYFNQMVWARNFGGFYPLPEGSRVLRQIKIIRR